MSCCIFRPKRKKSALVPGSNIEFIQEIYLVRFGSKKRIRLKEYINANPKVIRFAGQLIKSFLEELISPYIKASFCRAAFTMYIRQQLNSAAFL